MGIQMLLAISITIVAPRSIENAAMVAVTPDVKVRLASFSLAAELHAPPPLLRSLTIELAPTMKDGYFKTTTVERSERQACEKVAGARSVEVRNPDVGTVKAAVEGKTEVYLPWLPAVESRTSRGKMTLTIDGKPYRADVYFEPPLDAGVAWTAN